MIEINRVRVALLLLLDRRKSYSKLMERTRASHLQVPATRRPRQPRPAPRTPRSSSGSAPTPPARRTGKVRVTSRHRLTTLAGGIALRTALLDYDSDYSMAAVWRGISGLQPAAADAPLR